MGSTTENLLGAVQEIAVLGGKAALAHYGAEGGVEYKADNSPLTLADKASHAVIVHELGELTPEIPVLSEESPEEVFTQRKSWHRFNIALIDGDRPVLGVVHVPVGGVTYSALRGGDEGPGGAWVEKPGEERRPIRSRRADVERLTVVASKDHAGPRVKSFLTRLKGADATSMGSSLKFCLIAEGRADFYPRVVPTMEWDTAAAQCLVEAAGGRVTELDGRRLLYNKDDLRNPSIMTFGDPEVDWVRFFAGDASE